MLNFKYIDYAEAMQLFEKAEKYGHRLKIGDLTTSKWLQAQNIKLDEVVDFSKQMPDVRIFIIGYGDNQGFYIYSQKMHECYKFEYQTASVTTPH